MATDERDGSLAELERIGAEFGAEFVDALVRTAVLVRDLEQRFERHLADGAASVTLRLVPVPQGEVVRQQRTPEAAKPGHPDRPLRDPRRRALVAHERT